MKKNILLVGDHMNTEVWQQSLARAGFSCHAVSTMMEAVEYLKTGGHRDTALLVQENIPITRPSETEQLLPEEFRTEHVYDRGEALIRYARERKLITPDVPAYLATHRDMDCPEGVTKIISGMGLVGDVARQIAPERVPSMDVVDSPGGKKPYRG